MWARVNRRGPTVFVEDGVEWFKKKTESIPELKAYLVEYGTQQGQWRELIDGEDLLAKNFPPEVEGREWDVILVDGPVGYGDETTGRMKSIFLASRIAAEGGDVFVHDCDRIVESSYSDRFLLRKNLVRTTERLNHYRVARGSSH